MLHQMNKQPAGRNIRSYFHYKGLPHNLYFSCTFRLFLFPLRVIPIQLVEQNNQGRYQVQMFIHPARLQNAFRDVPLIGRALDTHTEDVCENVERNI